MGRPVVPFPVDKARRPTEGSALLSLTQVCDKLDVDYRRVYVLVDQGRLHALRLGGRWVYAEWEVDELLFARATRDKIARPA